MISVAIPCRNDGDGLKKTIEAFHQNRSSNSLVEYCVCDDASDTVVETVLADIDVGNARVKLFRSGERVGVARARNYALSQCSGSVVVSCDSHISPCVGWDVMAQEYCSPGTLLAGGIADPTSKFVAYGCKLIIPYMGTHWVRGWTDSGRVVQVPSAAATVIHKQDLDVLGGYDSGMLYYGGAEPEFGLRSWLSGRKTIAVKDFVFLHQFKPKSEVEKFIASHRTFLVHNSIRLASLYFDDRTLAKTLCTHHDNYPNDFLAAINLIDPKEVEERKQMLRSQLRRDTRWFLNKFKIGNC